MTNVIDIDGTHIEVLDLPASTSRTSAPFVLLHEGLGCVSLWKDFPHRLARQTGARVVAYSRAGYGQSTPHPYGTRNVFGAGYLHTHARETLPRVLDMLGIQHPQLIGHSDGGTIALIFAATYPDALRSLCVMAPHCFVEDLSVNSIKQAKHLFETTAMAERMSKHHRDPVATFYGWNDVWLSSAFRSMNIETLLPSITCPTLAIQGEDDEYGTLRQVEVIAEKVPTAQLLKLAQCGHAPWKDQSELVLRAIKNHFAHVAP